MNARELIEELQACEWRSSKFKFIAALGEEGSARAVEFLVRLALDASDLPLAEAAIWALGRSRSRTASRFLGNLYRMGNPSLKPAIVGALGFSADRAVAPLFLRDLSKALQSDDMRLARNLILALGPLKEMAAVPLLLELLFEGRRPPPRELRDAALLTLGRLARDPSVFDGRERLFQSDLQGFHLFEQARSQARFRSAWKLEDYLKKLFESESYHPALPLELLAYPAEEVLEGLSLFSDRRYFARVCDALRGVSTDPALAKYGEWLLKPEKLDDAALIAALRSLAFHESEKSEALWTAVRERVLASNNEEVFRTWISGVVSMGERAATILRKLVDPKLLEKRAEPEQTAILNAVGEWATIVRPLPNAFKEVPKLLENLFEPHVSSSVQARVARLFAQMGLPSSSLHRTIERWLDEDLAHWPSIWVYAEAVPQKMTENWILRGLREPKARAGEQASLLLRAIRAQESFSSKARAELEGFIAESLDKSELRALQVLARHPFPKLKPMIEKRLSDSDADGVRIAAAIALKALRDESAADALGSLLGSSSEAVRGRALDALTAIPGLRSKRIAIDYLKENALDFASVEKICRSLNPPESGTDYFVGVVDGVLRAHTAHPLAEKLQDLRDRLVQGKIEVDAKSKLQKKPDIEALDRELSAQIKDFDRIDEGAKTTLRSAEMIVNHPEIFDEYVDKSSAIIAYCKAIDLYLDQTLGRRLLMPRLESSLHEFQTALYSVGLADPDPRLGEVLESLALKGKVLEQAFPLHKMTLVAQGILNGRILHDPFKILDGLRAWAVILLIFPRLKRPLIPLPNAKDEQLVGLAKRLMSLQEVRNPAAHRQTVLDASMLSQIRKDVFDVLGLLQKVLA